MRRIIPPLILIVAGFTSVASAQTSDALRAAARSITPQDIQRRINIIADDSMMGRNTPSPGLEKTAQYVADQFRKIGLQPAGEHGTFFQRYTISQRRISVTTSHIGFLIHGKHLHVGLDRDARFAFGSVPAKEVQAPAVLLGGAYSAQEAGLLGVKGKAVILVMDYRKPLTPLVQQAVEAFSESGAVGIILLEP